MAGGKSTPGILEFAIFSADCDLKLSNTANVSRASLQHIKQANSAADSSKKRSRYFLQRRTFNMFISSYFVSFTMARFNAPHAGLRGNSWQCPINFSHTISQAVDSPQRKGILREIKLLTALTIILNIPTMVASLYGMNVDLPISKSPMAFIYIMFFIVIISVLAFMMFQKRKWL